MYSVFGRVSNVDAVFASITVVGGTTDSSASVDNERFRCLYIADLLANRSIARREYTYRQWGSFHTCSWRSPYSDNMLKNKKVESVGSG
jgi:hypothetical protein